MKWGVALAVVLALVFGGTAQAAIDSHYCFASTKVKNCAVAAERERARYRCRMYSDMRCLDFGVERCRRAQGKMAVCDAHFTFRQLTTGTVFDCDLRGRWERRGKYSVALIREDADCVY